MSERVDVQMYRDRYRSIVERVQRAERCLEEAARCVNTLPLAVQDGADVEELERWLAAGSTACETVYGMDEWGLPAATEYDDARVAILGVVMSCRGVAHRLDKPFFVAARIGLAFAKLREDAAEVRAELNRVAKSLAEDAQFCHAMAGRQPAATGPTVSRVRRMRARRKAGLTAHAIEVHHDDIRSLQRAGLIPHEGATQDDIRAAVQAWFTASMAIAAPARSANDAIDTLCQALDNLAKYRSASETY